MTEVDDVLYLRQFAEMIEAQARLGPLVMDGDDVTRLRAIAARLADDVAEAGEPPRIQTRCPSCGYRTLFVAPDGSLTCSWLPCQEPGVGHAVATLRARPTLAELEALPRFTLAFPGLSLGDPAIEKDVVLLDDVRFTARRRAAAEGVSEAVAPSEGQ